MSDRTGGMRSESAEEEEMKGTRRDEDLKLMVRKRSSRIPKALYTQPGVP